MPVAAGAPEPLGDAVLPRAGRVLPVGLRPRAAEAAAVVDCAPGGGGSGIKAKSLDGVFCLGADVEGSMQRAQNAKSADEPAIQVLGMCRAADALYEQGDLHRAAREVEQAQGLIQEVGFEEGRAISMVLVARIYAKQGALSTADQLDEALDLAADAQEKFKSLGAKKCEAAAWLALAMARHANKLYDEGNLAAKEAQLLLQQMNDKVGEAEVYKVVIDGYLMQNRCQKAASMVKKARALYVEIGDRLKEGEIFHKLGQIELKAYDEAKAFSALQTAQQMFREAGANKQEAEVLGTLKDYQLRKGRVSEAVQICQKMVTAHNRAGDTRAEGRAMMELSKLLIDQGQVSLAKKTADMAYKICSAARDGDAVTKAQDLRNQAKNESLKEEIRSSMDINGHVAHYPVQPVLDFELNKQVPAALMELGLKGL